MAIKTTVTGPSGTIYQGQPVTLTATVSGGTGTKTYQWYKRLGTQTQPEAISGATSQTLKVDTSALTRTYYSCVGGYAGQGTVRSNEFHVNVTRISEPAITANLPSGTYYRGAAAAQFSVTGTAPAGNITYQWQTSANSGTWSNISGATSGNYTASTKTVGTAYYRCVVTNSLYGYSRQKITDIATIVVNATPLPSISHHAMYSRGYFRGASATQLSVTATSDAGMLSYQWYYSSSASGPFTPIGGATKNTYTPQTTTVGKSYYKYNVSNTLNGYKTTVTSNSTAEITINATPYPEFSNSASFASAAYYQGATAKALNASTNYIQGTISYRWQKSIDGTTWINLNETGVTYTPPTATLGTTYYRAAVTNTLNGYTATTYSSPARIDVNDIPYPTISRQPASATYYRGATVYAIMVTASSPAGTVRYQWQRLANNAWSDIQGATIRSYNISTATVGSTVYRCIVTNYLNGQTRSVTSSTATITINDTPVPVFTNEYNIKSASYTPGDTAQPMNASASSEAGQITYQWQRSDGGGEFANIDGATDSTYTPPTDSEYTAAFRCVVRNTLNEYSKPVTSDAATITVSYTSAPYPSFTSEYSVSDFTQYKGAVPTTLNASATVPAGSISYQWQRSANGTTWFNISGATNATYSPETSTPGATYYQCVVTNTYGAYVSNITTNSALGTILDTPVPVLNSTASFREYDCIQGQPGGTLDATSSSAAGVVRYQWESSADETEWNMIAGATSSTYVFPTQEIGDAYYRCVIENTLNGYATQTISPTATVSTEAAQPVTITEDPQSAQYAVGAEARPLYVTFTGGVGPVSYQWQKSADGVSWSTIHNALNATYRPIVATADTTYYRVVILSGYAGYAASATSGAAEITAVVGAPIITLQPKSAEYNLRANSQPLRVAATAEGDSEISYQWQYSSNGTTWSAVANATEASYTPPTFPLGTIRYRCTVTAMSNGKAASSTSEIATITIRGEGQAPIFEYRLANAVYQYGDTIRPLNGSASSQDTNNITYQWYWSQDNETFYPLTGSTQPMYTPAQTTGGTYYYYVIATAHFPNGTITTTRSNTAAISIVNARSNFGNEWRMYLNALKSDFVKLARLEFLQPDGSIAFALDNNPRNRRSGAFIQTGTLTVNLQNGSRRTATVTLANLDSEFDYNVNKLWFGQQIRLSEGLILPDGEEFYLPQGVFYIKDPEEKVQPNTKTITYHLVDKWSYLDGTLFGKLDGIYEISRGTNIFTAIQSLLDQDRGNGYKVDAKLPVYTDYYNDQTSILPDGSIAPDTNLPYTYRNDAETGTYADIVLEMANVLAAWVGYDAAGRLRIDPSQDDVIDAGKPIQWEFAPTEKQFLGATYTIKNSDVYNDIIIVGESLTDYGYTAGRAQNADPSSDTNINIIGKKTLKESSAGFYSEKQCENLAVFKLKRFTVLQKSVTIQSAQLFHISENQLVTIRRPDKEGNPVERHLVTGFTRPIAQTGPMQINATSVNDLPTASIIYPGGQSRTSALLVGTVCMGTSITVYATAV